MSEHASEATEFPTEHASEATEYASYGREHEKSSVGSNSTLRGDATTSTETTGDAGTGAGTGGDMSWDAGGGAVSDDVSDDGAVSDGESWVVGPPRPGQLFVPSTPGDLADRRSILALKVERGRCEARRQRAREILAALPELAGVPVGSEAGQVAQALHGVNGRLWELEDEVRERSAAGDAAFVAAARLVPVMNDVRAHLKNRIDELCGWAPGDVKMYS